MKVVILGSGVVGVSLAWRLARDGHEVVVVDRQPGAGLETSFANGGQISASHAEPWANPAAPWQALRWLGRADAPLVVDWRRWDPPLWSWLALFLRNCTAGRARRNTAATLRLALYSRAALKELRQETGLVYDHRGAGILHIYRDPRAYDHARRVAEAMAAHGLARRPCGTAECVAIEPALAGVAHELAGGLFSPDDESGDAHLFTARLAALAAEAGVDFQFGTTAASLEAEGQRVIGIVTDRGEMTAGAYVLAAGVGSPIMARAIGLRLPIYPAKGYSVTVPVEGHAGAPTVSITDDERKMVFSRLGERLRAAGTAELAGWNAAPTPVRAAAVLANAQALFPDGGAYHRAVPWAGLRPKTPDSVPLIGRTPFANLFLDTGHGTLGWTMAAGSARILADLIAGRQPEIDLTGLGLERF